MVSLPRNHKAVMKNTAGMKRHSKRRNHSRRMNTTRDVNKVVGWAGIRALFMANSRSVCLQLLNWLLWLVQLPSCL